LSVNGRKLKLLERVDFMEQILNQILLEIKEIKDKVNGLEEGQVRIEKKLDAVYSQTADLTEFRTETRQNFNTISDNIRFLLQKEIETEKEIFLLKDKKVK
jgi:chromosome segregation ATPase